MKIGIIATSIWRSVHLDMAKALQQRGHQVVVYTEDATTPTIASFTQRFEAGVEILAIHHERRNPWLWLPDRHLVPSCIDTFNYSAVEAALIGTRSVMTDLVGSGYWLKKLPRPCSSRAVMSTPSPLPSCLA